MSTPEILLALGALAVSALAYLSNRGLKAAQTTRENISIFQATVDELRTRVDEQDECIEKLEAQIDALKQENSRLKVVEQKYELLKVRVAELEAQLARRSKE